MRRTALSALLVTLVGSGCGAAVSERAHPAVASAAPSTAESAIARALEERLTVWVRADGRRVYAKHCRSAPVDCRARIVALAEILEREARTHRLDPWLLAALAYKESGLDPSALGARGEAGIVQLHPRGAGDGVRYVEDAGFRERCQERVDACQGPVVVRGAQVLSESIERCGGVMPGLGRYATGRCTREVRYIERIIRERDRLRSLGDGR